MKLTEIVTKTNGKQFTETMTQNEKALSSTCLILKYNEKNCSHSFFLPLTNRDAYHNNRLLWTVTRVYSIRNF